MTLGMGMNPKDTSNNLFNPYVPFIQLAKYLTAPASRHSSEEPIQPGYIIKFLTKVNKNNHLPS